MLKKSLRLLSESGRILLLTSLLFVAAACANWAQDEYDYYRSLPAVSAERIADAGAAGSVDNAHMALLRMQFNGADFARTPGLKPTTPWTSVADSSSEPANGLGLRYDTTGYGSSPNLQIPQNLSAPSAMNGLGMPGSLGAGPNGLRMGSTPLGSSSIMRGTDSSYTGLNSNPNSSSTNSGW